MAGEVAVETAVAAQQAAAGEAELAAQTVAQLNAELEQARRDAGVKLPLDEIIFLITLTENFTPRDTLTIDLERTTNTTIEQENAYFEGTELAFAYIHKFTERIAAQLRASYRINDYPASITVGGQTGTRKDKIWLAGIGFNYTLTGGVEISLAYDFGQRESNFDTNDYDNNLVSLRVSLPF